MGTPSDEAPEYVVIDLGTPAPGSWERCQWDDMLNGGPTWQIRRLFGGGAEIPAPGTAPSLSIDDRRAALSAAEGRLMGGEGAIALSIADSPLPSMRASADAPLYRREDWDSGST